MFSLCSLLANRTTMHGIILPTVYMHFIDLLTKKFLLVSDFNL